MNDPSPPILKSMRLAAEWRATGMSWDRIAAKLRRSPRSCRAWRELYAEIWNRLFRAAEERLMSDTSTEAYLMLRKLSCHEDPRVARDASMYLHRLGTEREHETKTEDAPADHDVALAKHFIDFFRKNPHVRAVLDELETRRPVGLHAEPSEASPAGAATAG